HSSVSATQGLGARVEGEWERGTLLQVYDVPLDFEASLSEQERGPRRRIGDLVHQAVPARSDGLVGRFLKAWESERDTENIDATIAARRRGRRAVRDWDVLRADGSEVPEPLDAAGAGEQTHRHDAGSDDSHCLLLGSRLEQDDRPLGPIAVDERILFGVQRDVRHRVAIAELDRTVDRILQIGRGEGLAVAALECASDFGGTKAG